MVRQAPTYLGQKDHAQLSNQTGVNDDANADVDKIRCLEGPCKTLPLLLNGIWVQNWTSKY